MKKLALILFTCFCFTCIIAQPSWQQRIEDSVIGWDKVYNFKGIQYKPQVAQGRTYSAYQVALCDTFISWVQKSYTPIGGSGTVGRILGPAKNVYQPLRSGAVLSVWSMSFDAAGKKLQKIPETWSPINVITNDIPDAKPVRMLCNEHQYIFTRRYDGYKKAFPNEDHIRYIEKTGLLTNPSLSKYISYFFSSGIYPSSFAVILAPGNRLPIIALTKGEFLKILEDAIPALEQNEKSEAKDRYGNDPSYLQQEYKRIETEFKPRWLRCIANTREKYKGRMNEPAVLANPNDPSRSSLYNLDDPFIEGANKGAISYPVYKYEDGVVEKSRQDRPLWVTVYWDACTQPAANKNWEKQRSMVEHFNYDYVYDFFFNPDKLKGIPYKPVNEELLNATLNKFRKKDYGETSNPAKSLPANMHFMDDFLRNADGSKPIGWFSSSTRQQAIVTSIPGKPGKWVQLGRFNDFTSSTMKKPLPENFSLEFDIATDEFNNRTGGAVKIYLGSFPLQANGKEAGGNGASISLSIEAGNEADYNNNNYRGTAKIEIHSNPPLNTDNYGEGIFFTHNLREFTNKKTSLHVKLTIKSQEVTLFLNDKQVGISKEFKTAYGKPCISCGTPPGTLFKTLSFTNTTTEWGVQGNAEGVDAYISNVKIVKE